MLCKHLLAACALVMMFTAYSLAQETETEPQLDLSPDEKAIADNAAAFVKAFNEADAATIAGLFTEQGEMSVDGETIAQGRKAIEEQYAAFFQEHPDVVMSVHIDSIRQVTPNMVIEKGVSEIVNDADDSVVDVYTCVHVKEGDQWRTVSTDVKQEFVDPEYDWKAELGYLVGTWEASKEDWRVETKFSWVAGGEFLRRDFKVFEGDEETSKGMQVIGWDPIEGAVTSWVFTSDGGHGRGWWNREGQQWVVTAESMTPEGELITATNLFTPVDNDQFRWQSVNRAVSGTALEDSDPIRVKRTASSDQGSR